MIERYVLEPLGQLWTLQRKFEMWLKVELAVLKARVKIGEISSQEYEMIKEKAAFSVERVAEIEETTHHDLMAWVNNVKEVLREAGLPESTIARFHEYITSYDAEDPALSLMLGDAGQTLINNAREIEDVLRKLAGQHKWTKMIGRTHFVHAELITFGFKVLNWLDPLISAREALEEAVDGLRVGKISGAVGIYGDIDPRVEEIVCRELNLKPARIATQILSRRAHAHFLNCIAEYGGLLEKMAKDIRLGQQTERGELFEPFEHGQTGSSRMPHKRNPVICARVIGQTSLLRAYAHAMMEQIATEDERDIAQSSVERIVFPDSTQLLHYMQQKMLYVLEGLEVHPEAMMRNLELTKGAIMSGYVKSLLNRKGAGKEAYKVLQTAAFEAMEKNQPYKEVLMGKPEITSVLTPAELDECFDYRKCLEEPVDEIFARFGIKEEKKD